MSITRCRTVIGSLYGLMRNALGLNVATPLESQELSCTVAPDRQLVVLGHEPIAGFARDHGTVADEASMLALHTLDSATLLAEPTFIAPGDSCLRADDPGWRWHCIAGHGTTLADWERRPLAAVVAAAAGTAAFAGLTGAPADNATLAAVLAAKQAVLPNASALTRITETGGFPMWNGSAWPGGVGSASDLAMLDWQLRVERLGGALTGDSLALAQSVLSSLRTQGLLRKMMRLDLWLGADLRTSLIPLIDRLGKVTSAVGLTEASFSEASGMTFDGTAYILTGTQPADLGSKNGGLGWWESVSTASANVEPIGCYDSGSNYRYVLDLRDSLRSFRWGNPANLAGDSSGRAAAHYYGQRSADTLRRLYVDGVSVASNTTADPANGSSSGTHMVLGGCLSSGTVSPWPWTGRSKLAYFTDGSLSDAEVTALHSIMSDFVAATGR